MKWDEPARTLTQNFIYEASDNKIHPEQNRVLSVYEAMVLQTINRYEYAFQINRKNISTAKIAEVIGESVPPYLIEKICRMMVAASSVTKKAPLKCGQIQPKLRPSEVRADCPSALEYERAR